MVALLWVGIGIAAFLVLIVIFYYNKIVMQSNRIENAFSQIDVQLKKRADLVPNLVNTVKGYVKHEKGAIEAVTKAREKMLSGSMHERLKANNQITEALKSIFALAENYPQLRASEQFKLLQEQLEGLENKIAYSRQFYNDAILDLNLTTTTIPGMWFAALFGFKGKNYLQIEESERKSVKVEF